MGLPGCLSYIAMYDKIQINILFREFVFSKDLETLELLIEALTPMIDVVLSRWAAYSRHIEDARQEIKLRLWRNLQNFEIDRRKQLVNPSSYLFFLLRNYARKVLSRLPPDVFLASLDEILIQRNESTY